MKRRQFLTAAGVTASLAGTLSLAQLTGTQKEESAQEQSSGPARNPGPVKMYVGCQKGPTDRTTLQFLKRHGVDHVCGHPPKSDRGYWTVEELEQTRELCESEGVTLDMVALPLLTSSHIDKEPRGAIMLGSSPDRDRDIEQINIMTANCAKAGIPAWKYNLSLLGVLRTEPTLGRGGVTYSTWKANLAKDPGLTRAGLVDADSAWERIEYFLSRVIPVCTEHKIRAACHPHDPGVSFAGYQGIYRVLGTFDGLKKFTSIQESPYHGLNLCLGTMAENLMNPAVEIHDVIRYFGERKKIFNIHFRNIKGKRDDFQEVFLDNGDMNMWQVLQTLQEVGYDRMVMPDHVPHHPDDPEGSQGFAFSYGYIKGLLQALETSASA